jgi:galactokinase
VNDARRSFASLFGRSPAVRSSASGRVNLMGDHTDYNGGFVLPAAIPQTTRVELAASDGRTVRLWSTAYPDDRPIEYDLGSETRDGSWADYVKGMTVVLAPSGLERGFDARVESDVPVGSGLSSSAALEIAIGRAIREAFLLSIEDLELAKAARRAENEFVGAPVGIMDQMASSFATPTSALFLDTRTLHYEQVAIEHRHAGGGYVERRRECEDAAQLLGVRELRDVDERAIQVPALSDVLRRRVRHVVSENHRVIETVSAFRNGDLDKAGELFRASHSSLRDDFEVSTPEIDKLCLLAERVQGIYGVRLTGGGFGGAVVAIAQASRAHAAAEELVNAYRNSTGQPGTVVVPV